MKKIILLFFLFALAACSSTEEKAQSLFDRLEFDDDETGCVRMTSDLKLGGNPFVGSDTTVTYQKRKGENAPDC